MKKFLVIVALASSATTGVAQACYNNVSLGLYDYPGFTLPGFGGCDAYNTGSETAYGGIGTERDLQRFYDLYYNECARKISGLYDCANRAMNTPKSSDGTPQNAATIQQIRQWQSRLSDARAECRNTFTRLYNRYEGKMCKFE